MAVEDLIISSVILCMDAFAAHSLRICFLISFEGSSQFCKTDGGIRLRETSDFFDSVFVLF